jgi:type I restriction enzyme S subunit
MTQVKSLQTGIKFKDTPIGKIPVDWEVTKLGDVVIAFYNGGTPNTKIKEYWDGNIPWITGADFLGQKVAQIRKYITPKGVTNSATNIIPKGNLLVVTRTGVGKLAIAPFDIAISQDITGVIVDQHKTISDFLYWYLNHHAKQLKTLKQGTSINGILREDVSAYLISLPPLLEQNKITEIFSTVDDAIEKTNTIIEKTKELKKGLMQKLLTRGIGHKKFKKTEIGERPEEWKVVTLKDVASPERYSFVDGPFGSNLKTIHYKTLGVPVIQSQMVISGKFTPLDKYYVSPEKAKELERSKVISGDIVIAKIGVNFGASATIPDNYPDAILSGNTMKITPDKSKVVTQYLQYLLHYYREKKIFNKIVSTTAQPAITLTGVKNLSIPLPNKKEQKEIVDILTALDLELDNEIFCRQQLTILKKSLMQVLLTGRIRVKLH